MQEGDSTLVEHGPCEECGSRDNRATYSDGHSYCFGCQTYWHGDTQESRANAALHAGSYMHLPKRRLREETLRKFDYRVDEEAGAHYATYYDAKGKPVAQKIRRSNKSFAWVGEPNSAVLFGQQCWAPGGRKLVITEGEIDAMSMSQVQGNRWPVVSLKDGAGSAVRCIRENLEYVSSFEQVILMFDGDEPGINAAVEAAALLPPGKAFIARLSMKDPNDMLVAGRDGELAKSIWDAQPYRPDGIVTGDDLWDTLQTPDPVREADYPFPTLDHKLHGLRKAEIVMFAAGTGVGKSTICKEIAQDLIQQGKKVGMVALEETVKYTAQSLMSIYLNQPLHLEPMAVDDPRFAEAFDKVVRNVAFYDHWGSTASDTLLSKIRFMAVGLGCEYIVLDHISIVVSGLDSRDNERVLLDKAMTRLASLAREVNIGLLVVCHLKKSEGKPFEEGGQVSLNDLRGSGGIAQLSNIVIAAERNQQAESDNNLQLRILKNRFSGTTGCAGVLTWDGKRGRLYEPDVFEEGSSTSDTGKQGPEF